MRAELAHMAADTLMLLARHQKEAEPRVAESLAEIQANLFDSNFERPIKAPRHIFRQSMGLNPQDYLELTRTVIAARMLCDTNLTLEEISAEVGIKAASSLWHFFQRFFGCSPGVVRRAGCEARQMGREPFPTLDGYRRWRWRLGSVGSSLGAKMADRLNDLEREFGMPISTAEDPLTEIAVEGPVLRRQIRALLRHPRTERLNLLRRGVYRGSKEAFEALCEKSREKGRQDRQRGVELAEMALATVEGNLERLGERQADYLALGWARLSNARRVASDLEGAERAIRQAEKWQEKAINRERVRAEVLGFKGALRLFQRRFSEALVLLNDAVADSQMIGDPALLVDVLHQRAGIYLYRGDPKRALPDLDRAHPLVAPGDLRRQMGSIQLLLEATALAGDSVRAFGLLPEARRLCIGVGHRPSSLQIWWLEGLLLRERGELEEAELILEKTRAGFLELVDVGMTAVVSLELALLCHDQGNRASEVRAYASDALPALEALNLPEAHAAQALLRQAIAERTVRRGLIELARRRIIMPGAP